MKTHLFALMVLALLAASCSDDSATSPTTTSTTSTTSMSTTSSTSTPSTSSTTTSSRTAPITSTTSLPTDDCDPTNMFAVIDAALDAARLATGIDWSTAESDLAASPYAERTTDAAEYALRLGLDCGISATQASDTGVRLALAAWTGDRAGFLIQTNDEPATPYANEATVTVAIDSGLGEFVDGETRSIWAATLESGTFVVGHVDHALGAVAKGWTAGDRQFDDFTSLDSERHAIAALEEADMRNISVAEPPMFGSEEGYVQFTSPTGQLLVADIAPTDWFDPMIPRYFNGDSAVETIAGREVRVTNPTPDDNLGFTLGVEWGWACTGFVWILQPPFNGDAAEMRESVAAVLATMTCADG